MVEATAAAGEARTHTELLLESIGIKRIVVVDDEYAAISVEDVIGLCGNLDAVRAAALPHVQGIAFEGDKDIWAAQLRSRWEDLSAQQQSQLAAEARTLQVEGGAGPSNLVTDGGTAAGAAVPALADADGASDRAEAVAEDQAGTAAAVPDAGEQRRIDPRDDRRAAEALEDLLGSLTKCTFKTLSLAEWREQSKDLLEDDDAGATLFLFDRDFRRERQSRDEGFALVRAVQTRQVGYCGLITHTASLGEEYDAWSRLAQEHGLEKDRFVVIAKQRLTGTPPDHYSFLRMVRLAALSHRCAVVRAAAWKIFEESVQEARLAMERLSVLDFDQIILASSRREGVWEPDTLFRVFSVLMRREARARLHGENSGIGAKVNQARRVSAVPTEAAIALGTEPPCREALKIQHFEMYEEGDFLNRYCIPLDVGDIFEGGTGRRYIILAQPCDLMVRPNGGRSYDDKNGRCAALVELIVKGSRSPSKPSCAEVPYYEEGSGQSAFVDFAKVHHVQLAVLDLCALSPTGDAAIDVDAACPEFAIDPWKKRYENLKSLFASALQRYSELAKKQVGKGIEQLGLPIACTTVRFSVEVQGRRIRYGLKRVARLNQPRSGALLTAFAQYLSRAAFEHSFEHNLEDPQPAAADAKDLGNGGDEPGHA